MIDTLAQHLEEARRGCTEAHGSPHQQPHALVTLHRPSNVDAPATLGSICDFLSQVACRLKVIFPVHPRTQARLEESGFDRELERAGVALLPPQGYIENLRLMAGAKLVLTDSGGIQEETSWLSIPCLTLRENTERPCTLSHGTNALIGLDFAVGLRCVDEILGGTWRTSRMIPGWDGKASFRVVEELVRFLNP
jgi:UDP-N-acetylglucosamine 2-epimerase (non-hydrolysing)